MGYLSRNKAYEKKEPFRDAKKIFILTEGEKTEKRYFDYFIGLTSNINIITIPPDGGKGDPIKLMEKAKELFLSEWPKYILENQYKDEIWFVFDTDRWNEGGKISQLKEFCHLQSSSGQIRWSIAQSNPSFEIWLYYHFHSIPPQQEKINEWPSFKEFVNQSISGGFDSRKHVPLIVEAIQHSQLNYSLSNGQPNKFATEVHLLAQILFSFTQNEITEIRRRMGI